MGMTVCLNSCLRVGSLGATERASSVLWAVGTVQSGLNGQGSIFLQFPALAGTPALSPVSQHLLYVSLKKWAPT